MSASRGARAVAMMVRSRERDVDKASPRLRPRQH
jgi:hypothetical protein